MFKKITAKVISLICIAAIVLSTLVIAAAASYETENNDTIDRANTLNLNEAKTGSISTAVDNDWYQFTTVSSGYISLTFTHVVTTGYRWIIFIYKYNPLTLEKTVVKSFYSSPAEPSLSSPNIGLPSGTYYVMIGHDSTYSGNYNNPVDYHVKVNFTLSSSWEKEFNDDITTANTVNVNSLYSGSIHNETDNDWYQFTTVSSGYISLTFTHVVTTGYRWIIFIYKYNPLTLEKTEVKSFYSSPAEPSLSSPNIGLPSGTYYIMIGHDSTYSGNYNNPVDYHVKVNFTLSSSWEQEFNNDITTANTVNVNSIYSGSIHNETDNDWYRFSISKAGTVFVNFSHVVSTGYRWIIFIYKYNPLTLEKTEVNSFYSSPAEPSLSSPNIGLSAGTYYVMIGHDSTYSGNYNNPTDYQLTVYLLTPPSAPQLPKAVSASYNSVKVSWSAVSGAAGYAVYRSTSKTGTYSRLKTTNSTNYIDPSLTTGKTYYYKVFAYKPFNGTNIYSSSSAMVSAIPVPATPTNFKAVRYSATSIKLTWSPVAGASGYVVYKYNASTKTYARLKVLTATSYVNTGLTKGATYYYKVRAYRIMNSSPVYGNPTAAVSAKTY